MTFCSRLAQPVAIGSTVHPPIGLRVALVKRLAPATYYLVTAIALGLERATPFQKWVLSKGNQHYVEKLRKVLESLDLGVFGGFARAR